MIWEKLVYIIVRENTILWIGRWVCSAVLLGGRGEVGEQTSYKEGRWKESSHVTLPYLTWIFAEQDSDMGHDYHCVLVQACCLAGIACEGQQLVKRARKTQNIGK